MVDDAAPDDAGAQPLAADILMRRYAGATPEALAAVLCPLLIPIAEIDPSVVKLPGEAHYRASFKLKIDAANESVVERGRTGKFVPGAYVDGTGPWQEICKGRIIDVDRAAGIASGEIYNGSTKGSLEEAIAQLTTDDFLEIDQYGAAAKVLSGLAEYFLVQQARTDGYSVRRMPEDMARHLGAYANYDFKFEKADVTKKVEVKSLWGTNTNYARLIHSTTTRPTGAETTWTDAQKKGYYPTSSCKFATQDIFVVSLFLRTGNIRDFAFARSVPADEKPYGLPRSTSYPEHVHQNPPCVVGNGAWFATIDEVWNLD